MQFVQTAGPPPNHGRTNLPIMGCTWNNKNALKKIDEEKRIIRCAASSKLRLADSLPHRRAQRADAIDPRSYAIARADARAFRAARGNQVARVKRHKVAVKAHQLGRARAHIADKIPWTDGA